METQEQGLSRLKAILDFIGPGASLHIDDRWRSPLRSRQENRRSMASLLLADGGAIDGISTRGDVIDLDADHIASAQLAVDGQIEKRQVSPTSFDLKFRSDRPDVFWSQGRLCADANERESET